MSFTKEVTIKKAIISNPNTVSYYGKLIEQHVFTLSCDKAGIPEMVSVTVSHLNNVMHPYQNNVVAFSSLHYMIDNVYIDYSVRQEGKGTEYFEMLMHEILATIKEPIGAVTDWASMVDTYWKLGGKVIDDTLNFYEGACWFLFNGSDNLHEKLFYEYRNGSPVDSWELKYLKKLNNKPRDSNPRHKGSDTDSSDLSESDESESF